MQKPSRFAYVIRGLLLTAAALALYLPSNHQEQEAVAAESAQAPANLPAGMSLASAQTSLHAVLASSY